MEYYSCFYSVTTTLKYKENNMKGRKDKRMRKYDEGSYGVLEKYFLIYFQSYVPYLWGWIPSFYNIETPVSSDLSNKMIN